MEKKCFKCEEILPLSEFYAHPGMRDGHLGKCKGCTKRDAQIIRDSESGRERKRQYELSRKTDPERKRMLQEYRKRSKERFPEKYKARVALCNAVRDRRIQKHACEVCGDPKSQGHHSDYSKPLLVMWLCKKHHTEAHKKTGF